MLILKPALGFNRDIGSSLAAQPPGGAQPQKKIKKYLSMALCLVSICLIDSIAVVNAADDSLPVVDFLEGIGWKE
jgi:hypothetical protein